MTKDEIEAFVATMIEAGSNIQAIGTIGYVVVEPVDPTDKEAYRRIALVSSAFGDRDHLKEDIIAYLHEIGRVVEIQKEPHTGLI
jgi:transcriptional regulator NrdR family protein